MAAATAADSGMIWLPREKMKRTAGSVELGEGFSEDWERASLERMGVEKAEIDRIAPAVASEIVGPRTLAVDIAVEVSMVCGSALGYLMSSRLVQYLVGD